MKKKITMLFTVFMILILTCMPAMAMTVQGEADASAATSSVTTKAQSTGWVKTGKNYRYYYAPGKYYKSCVQKIDNKLFGFNKKGYLCCKWFTINKQKYYGSILKGAAGIGKGQILTGYRKIGKAFYYLNPAKNGAMHKGFVTIKGKLYYFDATTGKQRRSKGWFFANNAMYYVLADGSIAVNTTIDGYKIGANGAVTDVHAMDKKAQGYSSSTRYLILVNKTHHEINCYKGSKGHWTIVRRGMPCTIGKSATPTPSGSFKLDHKSSKAYGYKDFKASTVFYTTRISAGNYFHSILYKLGCRNPYTTSPKDSTLGKNKSNSCIRMRLEDAKLIHQVTPTKTRVVVY